MILIWVILRWQSWYYSSQKDSVLSFRSLCKKKNKFFAENPRNKLNKLMSSICCFAHTDINGQPCSNDVQRCHHNLGEAGQLMAYCDYLMDSMSQMFLRPKNTVVYDFIQSCCGFSELYCAYFAHFWQEPVFNYIWLVRQSSHVSLLETFNHFHPTCFLYFSYTFTVSMFKN